jgi:hypothetical protein
MSFGGVDIRGQCFGLFDADDETESAERCRKLVEVALEAPGIGVHQLEVVGIAQ